MIEFIAFVIFILLFILLVIDNLVIRRKQSKANAEILQLNIDKTILQESVQKLVDERSLLSIEQTDGFLNFVSQSRDWAFGYIEDIQESLEKFDKKMSQSFEYANTYGNLQPGPLLDLIHDIEAEYKTIKRFLPDKDANV